MLHRIVSIESLPGRSLAVEFSDGETLIKDLNEVISRGNLAAPLADPNFLRQVRITERGRSLLWPNGLEFCADALHVQGKKVNQDTLEYA
ncbi:MAG: DUF2442 domain-containing protein [Calditrichaeota bacterium]|nr:DUF2442 domain-containing protein [Calditrichota bacterium]